MISVKGTIEKVRTRLRDDDSENYRFGDVLLLDALNNAYLDLNYKFKLNVKKYTKQISQQDNILRTAKMFLSFEKAFLNGKNLPIQPFNDKAESLQISTFSDFQSLIVLPSASANGNLEVYVNEALKLELDDLLDSGDFLENALIFSSLISIFQIESNEANLQRVNFYEQLYKRECDRLRGLISGTREARSFITKFHY